VAVLVGVGVGVEVGVAVLVGVGVDAIMSIVGVGASVCVIVLVSVGNTGVDADAAGEEEGGGVVVDWLIGVNESTNVDVPVNKGILLTCVATKVSVGVADGTLSQICNPAHSTAKIPAATLLKVNSAL
jgi:hypothetical protein